VKRIISKDGTVKAVETSHGTVECDYFVNSAGRILVNITFKQGLFNSVSNFFYSDRAGYFCVAMY